MRLFVSVGTGALSLRAEGALRPSPQAVSALRVTTTLSWRADQGGATDR